MKNWLDLPLEKQQELFKQLAVKTGIQPQAIEKDAWVTLTLRLVFSSEIAKYLVFKGGTSLSKAYKLIKRFSEDIDIAVDRKFLGFEGDLTKGKIRKLRRKSHEFVSTQMLEIIIKQFDKNEIDSELYQIEVENTKISDQDPEIIKISYKSVFDELSYISRRVLIEIGARSLLEPFEKKEIYSIIDEYYPDSPFSENKILIPSTRPEKTFLEKLLLLHEEFQKPNEKIKYHRMSRHLYDIGQIITTEFGKKALRNEQLFHEIIVHRKKLTPTKSVDYETLRLDELNIVPPKDFYELYRKDYTEMQENMIYGESLRFDKLIELINNEYPAGNKSYKQ